MAEESPQPEINLEIESGGLKDRKVSWGKLRRVDSLNLEAGRLSFKPSHRSQVVLYCNLLRLSALHMFLL